MAIAKKLASISISSQADTSKNIRYESRLALNELAVAETYKTAYRHFRYLQRRWKWSEKYPNILRRLVEVDLPQKEMESLSLGRNLYRNFQVTQPPRTGALTSK